MGAWLAWRGVLRPNEHAAHIGWWCPACQELHVFDERWAFDGNFESPTFTPSLCTKNGHYVTGVQLRPDGKCGWCEEAREDGRPTPCMRCHVVITKGELNYQADCTHAMAGQKVPMCRPPPTSEDA